jgi:RNA polymerase sigma-70 factor, ECF subfamily
MTDEELIGRISAGDREALGELFRRHEKPLYNFFLRAGGTAQDAEDQAMETLLRVFRGAAGFRGGSSFRAWLYRIALNVARDRSRSARRRPELLASGLETLWTSLEDDRGSRPESMALRSDLAAAVRAAVDALPERERNALLLREYQQLSMQEVGTVLGISEAAAKMLICRARKSVRRRLESRPVPDLLEVCP